MALDHRGCRRTKLGDVLLLLLSTQAAQADHGAEDSSLYAASQPWPWQWHWPQADVPWPEEPIWHPGQVPLEVPAQANSSTPLAAAHTRGALGPAAEDLESNWSFSCTSVAPDGRFSHRSSASSHENSAAPTPATQSPPAPLGKTAEVRDREEAETTTTALTSSVAVQPVSLSTPSPSLAKVATKSPAPGKAVEDRAGAEATTTALTASVVVQQVSPSTPPSSLAKDVATKPTTIYRFGDWSTAEEVSRYIEAIEGYRSAWDAMNLDPKQRLGYEFRLRAAAEEQETFRRREARAARRQAKLQLDADRPEHRSAASMGAG